jgi:rubrerythrin
MSVIFNADEIFQVAIQIERNGNEFYKQAAKKASSDGLKKKLLDLARMELEHEKTFSQMRDKLMSKSKEPVVFDPQEELAMYLNAFAKGQVFSLKPNGDSVLKDIKEEKDILKTAINLEIESIALYTGLEDLVPEKFGKADIKKIIRQEMSHVQILSAELEALG